MPNLNCINKFQHEKLPWNYLKKLNKRDNSSVTEFTHDNDYHDKNHDECVNDDDNNYNGGDNYDNGDEDYDDNDDDDEDD